MEQVGVRLNNIQEDNDRLKKQDFRLTI